MSNKRFWTLWGLITAAVVGLSWRLLLYEGEASRQEVKRGTVFTSGGRILEKESEKGRNIMNEEERDIYVTEGVRHSVPLDEIVGGGPPKDGIPSIDNPQFVPVAEAGFIGDSVDRGDGRGLCYLALRSGKGGRTVAGYLGLGATLYFLARLI